MERCEYCGRPLASGGIQSKLGTHLYCGQKCYEESGQKARDAETEHRLQTTTGGKLFRGIGAFVVIGGLVYLLLDALFSGLPSALTLLIAATCGAVSGALPRFRNSRLPLVFPAAVIVLHFILH